MLTTSEARKNTENEYNISVVYWMKRGTIFSALASVFSLAISILTYAILQNQLHAMRVDNRAWLTVEGNTLPLVENKPLEVEFKIKNVGKTPAMQVEQSYDLQIVPAKEDPKFWATDPKLWALMNLINPNDSVPITIPRIKDQPQDEIIPLTKAEIDNLRNGKFYVAILAKIKYIDIYGSAHWVLFCRWYVPPGATNPYTDYNTERCAKYNGIDR